MRADGDTLTFGHWAMKAADIQRTQRWTYWKKWPQWYITHGWPLEEDVFCILGKSVFLWKKKQTDFFTSECLRHYLKSPQEELHSSQLTAVKYPCNGSSQIPLKQRQSIRHPSPHLCPALGFTNIFCVMLSLHKSAQSSPELCRRSPRPVAFEDLSHSITA